MIETVAPLPSLRHLARLPDAVGIFKHVKLDCPRLECGYCTDDAGRLLAIASRLARDSKVPLLAEVVLFPRTGSSWPGAGSVCRRVLMALGRTISSPGAGTRSPRRSLLQRWMFEAEVRGLAEGHEGSIAQVRPRCRCRRRRSETEQSPAGSVVAGERPFDRFRRSTNQAGGHGLGLSIAVPPAECRGRCFRLRERPVDRSDLLRCRRAILARVLASIVHEFGRETVDSLRRCRDDRGSASNPFQLQV